MGPLAPQMLRRGMIDVGGSSSVAERQLPKLNVAGSIAVSRSNPERSLTQLA